MNDAVLEDLKQFIDAKFSQAEARNEERFDQMDRKIDQLGDELRQEMRDGFAGVADAMEETNKVVDTRLTKLEQQVAAL